MLTSFSEQTGHKCQGMKFTSDSMWKATEYLFFICTFMIVTVLQSHSGTSHKHTHHDNEDQPPVWSQRNLHFLFEAVEHSQQKWSVSSTKMPNRFKWRLQQQIRRHRDLHESLRLLDPSQIIKDSEKCCCWGCRANLVEMLSECGCR